MKIIRSPEEFMAPSSTLALGTFDGVHIGHQRLIGTAVQTARALQEPCIVCTFDRHPMSVIAPDRAPRPILTLRENLDRFEKLGADYVYIRTFTCAFASIEPEAYIRMLVKGLRANAIVVGENHTFGRQGKGTPELLDRLAAKYGYRAVIVPPVRIGTEVVSSTYIRKLIADGQNEEAQALLAL